MPGYPGDLVTLGQCAHSLFQLRSTMFQPFGTTKILNLPPRAYLADFVPFRAISWSCKSQIIKESVGYVEQSSGHPQPLKNLHLGVKFCFRPPPLALCQSFVEHDLLMWFCMEGQHAGYTFCSCWIFPHLKMPPHCACTIFGNFLWYST